MGKTSTGIDFEPLRLDVGDEDRVALDDHRLAEEDGFQEGVAESLVEAGVGDQVGLPVDVGQRIGLASFAHPCRACGPTRASMNRRSTPAVAARCDQAPCR